MMRMNTVGSGVAYARDSDIFCVGRARENLRIVY
jgi:hypothetical protein